MKGLSSLKEHSSLSEYTDIFAKISSAGLVRIEDNKFDGLVDFLQHALPGLIERCTQPDSKLELGQCLSAMLHQPEEFKKKVSCIFANVYTTDGWSITRFIDLMNLPDDALTDLYKILSNAQEVYKASHSSRFMPSLYNDEFWKICINLTDEERKFLAKANTTFYAILNTYSSPGSEYAAALRKILEEFHFVREFDAKVDSSKPSARLAILQSPDFDEYKKICENNRLLSGKSSHYQIELHVLQGDTASLKAEIGDDPSRKKTMMAAIIKTQGIAALQSLIRRNICTINEAVAQILEGKAFAFLQALIAEYYPASTIVDPAFNQIYKDNALDLFLPFIEICDDIKNIIDFILDDCNSGHHKTYAHGNRFLTRMLQSTNPNVLSTFTSMMIDKAAKSSDLFKTLSKHEGNFTAFVMKEGERYPTLLYAIEKQALNLIPHLLRSGLSFEMKYQGKSLWEHLRGMEKIGHFDTNAGEFSSNPAAKQAFNAELPLYKSALINTIMSFVPSESDTRKRRHIVAFSDGPTSSSASFEARLRREFIWIRNAVAESHPVSYPRISYSWLNGYKELLRWPDVDIKLSCKTQDSLQTIEAVGQALLGERVQVIAKEKGMIQTITGRLDSFSVSIYQGDWIDGTKHNVYYRLKATIDGKLHYLSSSTQEGPFFHILPDEGGLGAAQLNQPMLQKRARPDC